MKTLDLNGKEHVWNLSGYVPNGLETRPRSELHLQAREILKNHYKTDRILEEVHIPGHQLFLDFFIPRLHLAIEVHGEQHFRYISFFHGNPAGFARAKKNDRDKEQWCKLNNIKLIVFAYNDANWGDKLVS